MSGVRNGTVILGRASVCETISEVTLTVDDAAISKN